MSVVERHLKALAAAAAKSATPKQELSDASKLVGYRLQADKNRLRRIASMVERERIKAELVDSYSSDVAKAIIEGECPEFLVHVMIWAFDAGKTKEAVTLAYYALSKNATMPEGFSRTLPAFLAENSANLYKQRPSEEIGGFCLFLTESLANCDMLDQIRGKLLHAAGEHQASKGLYAAAVELMQDALKFDSHIRCKKRIKELQELCPSPQASG